MTKFILVRHGKPTYDEKTSLKTAGFIMITDKEINTNLKQMWMEKKLCKK